MKNKKDKIIVILGQTTTGKSSLAVQIAKKYNGEIISADSRQVYKGLNIGTGKITKKETLGIPHHLLDVVSPKKVYSVADWKKEVEVKIDDILSKNKLPIICGGTGFYIQSIVDGIILPEVKPNIALREKLKNKTAEQLAIILKKIDSKRFKKIDINNRVRLIRAIEIAKELGSVPDLKKENSKYEIIQIGLRDDSEDLKQKINTRLKLRMKKGMLIEAKNLHKEGLSYKRMRELGLEYKFLADLLEEKTTKKVFLKNLENEIWQYAKRQMTWFKKDSRIKWFKPNEVKKIDKEIHSLLNS